MGCVQSYFRKAHSAGLSPSSTQASENAGLIPESPTEPVKAALQAVKEDAVITSQEAVARDSNGTAPKTGLGLGPGVAALAASTGTVAILGATADTTLDAVESVQQVAEEVVKDVQEAAEEAVKSAKAVAADAGKEVEGLVERVGCVVEGITSSSAEDIQTPEVKDDAVPASPIPEDDWPSEDAKQDASLVTSPLPVDNKVASVPTSPIADDDVPPSKEASPLPPVDQEAGQAKDETSLSLSSLPEDSIPSSIKQDAVVSSPSPSPMPSSDEKPDARSPLAEPEASNVVEVPDKEVASRPTSGVTAGLQEKTEVDVVDETFPEPPPPEVQETTSGDVVDEAEEAEVAEVRTKRSAAEQEKFDEQKQEQGDRQAAVDQVEAKKDDVKENVDQVEAKKDEIKEIFNEVKAETDAVQKAAESLTAHLESVESASSLRCSNPQIEVSAPSRPQSSDVEFIGVGAAPEEVPETIEQAADKAETPEAEDAPVRPTSAQVEEKAEQVVNEVVQTVTQMVTTAATTIQATFRGHQTRQHLRQLDCKDADVSLDAKSSDTDAVEDSSFPAPLNDVDSELLSTSTEMEQLQPVVHVSISAEPVDSRPGSELEKVSERPSSEAQESVATDEAPRAASVVSESTASAGDSVDAVKGSEAGSETGSDGVLGAAATTIQASFRGFQARQNLSKAAVDDAQLPVPEPLQDVAFDDVADEDDLPPPPEECDVEAPAAADVAVETPRSPETGEKLLQSAGQVTSSAGADDDRDGETTASEAARKLALLQRPQQCDELPEHRGEVAVEAEPKAADLVNGLAAAADAASSAEVDDSSLSSAATKIQAGARGYLTRKIMKDTFSTTAPSITDSQSVGATLTSDDGFHTSGSFETEVQRQMDEQNIGVTAVVIANVVDCKVKTVENGISGVHDEIVAKGLSLDSQLPPAPATKTKSGLPTAVSETGAKDAVEDRQVWHALQGEMEEAATKIQSNFRGYRTRQRLHRENAVQVTTSSGTPATTSQSSESPPPLVAATATAPTQMRSSGEFHDMLLPEPADVTSDSWDDDGDDALARRQMSDLGTRLEGHVVDVATPLADGVVSAMGKARETTSARVESVAGKEMSGVAAKAAATKIQAGFRGYKVRKQMKQLREKKGGPRRRSSVQLATTPGGGREKMTTLQDKSATTIQAGVRGFLVRKRRLEEKNAAVKIQAGFRGYKVRRDVKTRAPVEK